MTATTQAAIREPKLVDSASRLAEAIRTSAGAMAVTVNRHDLLLVLAELKLRMQDRDEVYLAQACVDAIRGSYKKGQLTAQRLDAIFNIFDGIECDPQQRREMVEASYP